MIKTFADAWTARIFSGRMVKGIAPDLARRARDRLVQLDQARTLADLAVPPGNQLEKLTGDRAGQYSIRVGRQWRVCFIWRDGDAFEVWFGDYHD